MPDRVLYSSFAWVFLLLFSHTIQAQNKRMQINRYALLNYNASRNLSLFSDSLKKTRTDSVKIIAVPKHSPKVAVLLSAVVPGAGQFYNKKYWKIPVVWAGLGVCGYFIRSNHILYRDYKDALLQRVDTNITEPDKYLDIYSTDQLITLQDQYRQNRDLFIIVTSLVYVLNIVDALVDAHLYTFDVSDDLSINWQPYYNYSVYTKSNAGLSFQLKF